MKWILKRLLPNRMKGAAAVALYALLSTNGMALEVERDKQIHFGISFFFGYWTETFLHRSEISKEQKVLFSTGIAFVPSIVKELMDDESKNNRVDYSDLSFGALGALTGALTAYYLNNNFFMTADKKDDVYAIALGYRF